MAGLVLGALVYALSMSALNEMPRRLADAEMRFVLPRMVQIVMTAGDRYLAANLASIRALVAPPEGMGEQQYEIQARVHMDAAVLNPAHHDNYFIAAAVLPWNGQLDAAQFVLRRASDARPFDLWPPYQYAFHEWHFRKNPLEAVKWLYIAADRTANYKAHYSLKDMAARWMATSDDLPEAIRVVRAMAESSKDKAFKRYLMQRVQRLENLHQLREAAKTYKARFQRSAESVDDLVRAKLIDAVPKDPFGTAYVFDPAGSVVLQTALKRALQRPPAQASNAGR